jgi:hypothetical protein
MGYLSCKNPELKNPHRIWELRVRPDQACSYPDIPLVFSFQVEEDRGGWRGRTFFYFFITLEPRVQ